MKEIIQVNNDDKTEPTLCEQRLQLILRLQLNRRVLIHQLSDNHSETNFPRSMIMRFITQENTLSIVKNITFSLLGARTLKALFTGFSFMRLARAKLSAHRTPPITH
jgi:hypothetical protein